MAENWFWLNVALLRFDVLDNQIDSHTTRGRPVVLTAILTFEIIYNQLDPATTSGRLVMLTAPRPRGLHVTFATVRAYVLFHLREKR